MSTTATTAQDLDTSLHLQSAYEFRGVTQFEDPVWIPAGALFWDNGWFAEILGVVNTQPSVPANPDDDQEFSRVHARVEYSLPLTVSFTRVGWVEYWFPGGDTLEDTRELYVGSEIQIDLLTAGATLYYDLDELDDLYGELYVATSIVLHPRFRWSVQASLGASGDPASGGTSGGLREYRIRNEGLAALSPSMDVHLFAEYAGSADTDVLPTPDEPFIAGVGVRGRF